MPPRPARLHLTLAAALAACGPAAPTPPPATPAVVNVAAAPAATAEEEPPPEKPVRPRPPPGYVEVTVVAVVPSQNGAAVLLGEAGKRLVVPIYIGGTEAHAITLRMNQEHAERPLTHDLLDSVIRELDGELFKVQVDELRQAIFIGSVFLRREGRIIEIDARPSDAIALALGNKVPIFMAREVLEAAGEESPDLPQP